MSARKRSLPRPRVVRGVHEPESLEHEPEDGTHGGRTLQCLRAQVHSHGAHHEADVGNGDDDEQTLRKEYLFGLWQRVGER